MCSLFNTVDWTICGESKVLHPGVELSTERFASRLGGVCRYEPVVSGELPSTRSGWTVVMLDMSAS